MAVTRLLRPATSYGEDKCRRENSKRAAECSIGGDFEVVSKASARGAHHYDTGGGAGREQRPMISARQRYSRVIDFATFRATRPPRALLMADSPHRGMWRRASPLDPYSTATSSQPPPTTAAVLAAPRRHGDGRRSTPRTRPRRLSPASRPGRCDHYDISPTRAGAGEAATPEFADYQSQMSPIGVGLGAARRSTASHRLGGTDNNVVPRRRGGRESRKGGEKRSRATSRSKRTHPLERIHPGRAGVRSAGGGDHSRMGLGEDRTANLNTPTLAAARATQAAATGGEKVAPAMTAVPALRPMDGRHPTPAGPALQRSPGGDHGE